MKKITLRDILATIGFCLVFLLIFNYLTSVFIPKYSYEQLRDYKKVEKESMDVFYIGTSHIACSVSPMQVWSETGLTGYNFSTAAQGPESMYLISADSLKKHKPKVVFLETSRVLEEYDVDEYKPYVSRSMDQRFLSKEKLELIMELRQIGKRQSFKEYAVPLIANHKRWKELNQRDFENYDNRVEKGQRMVWSVKDLSAKAEATINNRKDESTIKYKYNKTSLEYYEKTIELYKENDVEVVLIEIPQYYNRQEESKAIRDLAEKHDVKYLDCNEPKVLKATKLNPKTDFYGTAHLNPWGASTLSTYISKYLKKNFDVEDFDQMPENKFDYWITEYEEYYWLYNDIIPGKLTNPEKLYEKMGKDKNDE